MSSQYSSWLVHSYSRHITRTPKSQAPDLSAFLFRLGFDPDESHMGVSENADYIFSKKNKVQTFISWSFG